MRETSLILGLSLSVGVAAGILGFEVCVWGGGHLDPYENGHLYNSVTEPKLFIFGCGFDFDHNFGSSYTAIYNIGTLNCSKIVVPLYLQYRGRNELILIVASSKLTAEMFCYVVYCSSVSPRVPFGIPILFPYL